MTFKEARKKSRELNKRLSEAHKLDKKMERKWDKVRKRVCNKIACSDCIGWNRCRWKSSGFFVTDQKELSIEDILNWAKGKKGAVQ